METNREKARKLYIEYRHEYHFAGFNQSAFHQRVRRLAKQVNPDKDWDAFMYLKYIETRMNAIFSFADRGAWLNALKQKTPPVKRGFVGG